jgi:hypothetical protein
MTGSFGVLLSVMPRRGPAICFHAAGVPPKHEQRHDLRDLGVDGSGGGGAHGGVVGYTVGNGAFSVVQQLGRQRIDRELDDPVRGVVTGAGVPLAHEHPQFIERGAR